MICILHGYLLEGSGSNLWTRSIVEALCRQGHNVHLMAQENHAERYPFITRVQHYRQDGSVETETFEANPYRGSCTLHKPDIGDTLPVYVWDRYDEFSRVVPMIELSDPEIEAYVEWNAKVLQRIVVDEGITAIHANHSVLMPQVAQRAQERTGVPYSIMPHGSGLEFAVKRDIRFQRMAEQSYREAGLIFVHGTEMRARVRAALPDLAVIERKFFDLHLGVDTSQFEPVSRAARAATIDRLLSSLHGLPRGRTAATTQQLLDRLHAGIDMDSLMTVLEQARGHDDKTPDADVEAKLRTVDWSSNPTLLYVGRLISTKGIQSVFAALPFMLRARPDLRLIVVGHGPLREPLEALLWAMQRGDATLMAMIAEQGRVLENSPLGESGSNALTQVLHYFERLRERGEFDEYLEAARTYVRSENVIFTGYLTHRELHLLFPCCDAAVFPSVVKEAGPLVFLEALASGAFPLGTYFGGMQESIDSLADALPADAVNVMKLSPDTHDTVDDIVRHVPLALELGKTHQAALFRVARERYDWSSVARMFHDEIERLSH